MKTIFIRILKLIGLRTAVKLIWYNLLLPELRKLVKQNDATWDDDLLENIEKIVSEAIKRI